MGLDKDKTVFKIPISLEGTRACKLLVNEGFQVNLHLVYTLQQAYMAFAAGATYVCPLVGRLQDQGHDALGLVEQCVETVEKYGYQSKIMFSSVRHMEHVKNALNIGVHTITVPWKVMKNLTDNHFTAIGTEQFVQDTKLLTQKVGDVVRTENVSISADATVYDALLLMTKSKLGAVAVMNQAEELQRVFTDGDLRRLLNQGADIHQTKLSSLEAQEPLSIDLNATLFDAQKLFSAKQVDTLVAKDGVRFVGLIDVQQTI